MKKIIVILIIALNVSCMSQTKSLQDYKWFYTQAISDSADHALIIPGLHYAIADTDTVFQILSYSGNKVSGLIKTKDAVCDSLLSEYDVTVVQIEQLNDELARLQTRKQEIEAKQRMMKNWYKLLKNKFGIDCLK